MNVSVKVLETEKQRKNKKGNAKLEGCLSIKDVWGTVKRSQKIEVTYMDESGEMLTKIFSGWPATIIQHEYDHLQGILFPRRVLEQKGKLYKTHKDEKGEDIFDRVDI